MKAWALPFLLLLLLSLMPEPCFAAVHRFAVVVGNNEGDGSDAKLRYAESDARKMARVLRDLGDFQPANLVILTGENKSTVRSTLIAVNDRIRAVQASPSDQALLFVYYSGHADYKSLRLGASRLPFLELAQLVRGSSATYRLLVVDACRSGTLTRVKGGRRVAAFDLNDEERLPGQGMAFLTASSQNEDAQESDEIRGSFFTHSFVSGLLGAADKDGDGTVDLNEAYRYARDATIRTTSRTYAGTQHPTFQFDVRGQDSLVLTRLKAQNRSQVLFPPAITFLVMANNDKGAVIGELSAGDRSRKLSLRRGNYFIRGRGPDYLLEGTISVGAGETLVVEPDKLSRAEFDRLVRKGTDLARTSHSVDLGVSLRSELPNSSGACWGGEVGYQLALASISIGSRASVCTSRWEGSELAGRMTETALSLHALHVWDFSDFNFELGGGLGGALSLQSFETRGEAPDRLSLSPLAFITMGLSFSLTKRYFLAGHLRGEGSLVQFQDDSFSESYLQANFAVRGSLVTGIRF